MTAPDHAALDQALADYETAVEAQVAGLGQQLADAQGAAVAVIAQRDATIADLRAQLAPYLRTVVTLPDFTQSRMASPAKVLDNHLFTVTAQPSKIVAAVQALVKGKTNNYSALGFDGAGITLSNITLAGGDIGCNYNGIRLEHADGATLTDVTVEAIPGDSSGPPGETFHLNGQRDHNGTYLRLRLDGKGKGATGLGLNYTTGTETVTDSLFTGMAAGFGTALFQCEDEQIFTGCTFTSNRKHINIEQSKATRVVFDRCVFDRPAAVGYVAQISSLTTSTRVEFRDCTFPGDVGQVRTFPGGVQRDIDITCIVGGQDVTNDPTRLRIVHTG